MNRLFPPDAPPALATPQGEALLAELLSTGQATLQLSGGATQLMRDTVAAALAVFRLPKRDKAAEAYLGLHLGYRGSGIEYSATADRPDLNECLSYSGHARHAIAPDSAARGFYTSAAAFCGELDAVVHGLLCALRSHYRAEGTVPQTSDGSWLQANYYRPAAERRAELQDRHEDGHLLTLWNSGQAGMEIFPGGEETGVSVVLPPDRMLVLPGSLLTMLTGGDVAPLFHRVSRAGPLIERISLMYFVNPSRDGPLHSYNPRPGENPVDIAAVGASNPTMFGLPKIGPAS